MNCHNCEKYVKEAIDTVYEQTYKDWEIIFWDNASTDNSGEIAKSYDNKLKYFRNEKTVPLGKARNWAMEKAQGKYIAFLDCDDIWFPKKLEKQIPIFENNSKIGIVICDTIFFNEKGDIKQLYANKKPPVGKVFRDLLSKYYISLETAIIRKKTLDNLNEWFDERFNMIEESELFTRIAYKWRIGYLDEPQAKWRIHDTNWSYSHKKLAIEEKEIMLEKFKKIFQHFDVNYHNEINLIKANISLRYSILDWENNKKISARKRLRPYLFMSYKNFVIYFLTFLPYSIYKKLYRIKGMDPL